MPKLWFAFVIVQALTVCLHYLHTAEAKAIPGQLAPFSTNTQGTYLRKVHPFLQTQELTANMKSLLRSLRRKRLQRRRRESIIRIGAPTTKKGPLLIAIPTPNSLIEAGYLFLNPESLGVVSVPHTFKLVVPSLPAVIKKHISSMVAPRFDTTVGCATTLAPVAVVKLSATVGSSHTVRPSTTLRPITRVSTMPPTAIKSPATIKPGLSVRSFKVTKNLHSSSTTPTTPLLLNIEEGKLKALVRKHMFADVTSVSPPRSTIKKQKQSKCKTSPVATFSNSRTTRY